MRARICFGVIGLAALGVCNSHGQIKRQRLPSPAQLQVSVEQATTTNDGRPSALRVIVKNAGNLAVWMPALGQECTWVYIEWSGELSGYGCGDSGARWHTPERIAKDWVQLRPGEFMSTTVALSPPTDGRKSEYCAVYVPPRMTKEEAAELLQAGYVIPTEEVKSDPQEYPIR